MATATFDKEIEIGQEAADRLVAALRKPTREIKDMREFFKESEEKWQCYLKGSLKSLQTEKQGN